MFLSHLLMKLYVLCNVLGYRETMAIVVLCNNTLIFKLLFMLIVRKNTQVKANLFTQQNVQFLFLP